MEYVYIGFFLVTSVIVLTGSVKMFAVSIGNSINLPPFFLVCPTAWFFWYPSLGYQVWHWSNHFGVI